MQKRAINFDYLIFVRSRSPQPFMIKIPPLELTQTDTALIPLSLLQNQLTCVIFFRSWRLLQFVLNKQVGVKWRMGGSPVLLEL